MNDTRLERFVEVSQLLLERDGLDADLACVYLGMLDDLDPSWPLDDMADAFDALAHLPIDEREQQLVAELDEVDAWQTAAASVLQVWFSGGLTRADGSAVPQPAEAYLGALLWSLVRTQPSGLPGPFFGEWAYPPTRADDPLVRWARDSSTSSDDHRSVS